MARASRDEQKATLPLSEDEEFAPPTGRSRLEHPIPDDQEGTELSSALPIRTVMTAPVVTIRPADSVFEALTRMIERGVSGLPVVTGQRVVGIISQNDVGRLLAESTRLTPMGTVLEIATARGAEDPATPLGRHAAELRKLRVEEAMTPGPVTINDKATVGDAVELMESARVKRLPILDAKGKLVGIVTRRNLLSAMLKHRGRSHAL